MTDTDTATLQDYVALFRRRRAVMFIAFSAVALSVVAGIGFIKDEYRSTATIAIERPEIPENMVRTTFTYFDTDLHIDRIRGRVLRLENVRQWIEEYDLYPEILADGTMRDAAREFRSDVEVITIQAREDIAVRKQGETIAFTVSYYGATPRKAADVATELAQKFLEENRSSRSASVMETVEFFRRDAERLAQEIEEAEQRLAEFKERNSGALPASSFANTQLLDRYERELADVERDVRDLRETRQILETELSKESPYAPIFSQTGEAILAGPDRLKLLQQQLVELSAKYGPEHPDVIRTQREIELLSADGNASVDAGLVREELTVARREYAAARERYAADHPDVRKLATKVRTLEARLASLDDAGSGRGEARPPDNPEYISIQVQIEAADEEIAALRSRARDLRRRISQQEQLIAESPQVEREYLVLQREYDQAIEEYAEIRDKQTEAQQALALETSEKGERYVLQRMPEEPVAPAFPNRVAITILGMILAAFVSIGAVFLAEALDARVRGVRDLKVLTGMPPIAVIPVLETPRERRQRALAWSFSLVSVFGALSLLIAFQI